jgi:hypothetical protein
MLAVHSHNYADSGSEGSWFDPRRGNAKRRRHLRVMAAFVFRGKGAPFLVRVCQRIPCIRGERATPLPLGPTATGAPGDTGLRGRLGRDHRAVHLRYRDLRPSGRDGLPQIVVRQAHLAGERLVVRPDPGGHDRLVIQMATLGGPRHPSAMPDAIGGQLDHSGGECAQFVDEGVGAHGEPLRIWKQESIANHRQLAEQFLHQSRLLRWERDGPGRPRLHEVAAIGEAEYVVDAALYEAEIAAPQLPHAPDAFAC